MCMGLEDMSERLSTTVSDGPPSYAVLKRTDQFTLAVQKALVVGRQMHWVSICRRMKKGMRRTTCT